MQSGFAGQVWAIRWLAGRLLWLALLGLGGGAAQAQLRLPTLPGPGLPGLGGLEAGRVPDPTEPLRGRAERLAAPASLQPLRQRAIRELLDRAPGRVELDSAGEPVRRGELLLLSPPPTVLEAARALGYALLRDEALDDLDLHVVALSPPAGVDLAAALARLRALDPALQADFNHLYLGSGRLDTTAPRAPTAASEAADRTPDPSVRPTGRPPRVGLIDSGVDGQHAALRRADLHRWGCEGPSPAGPHGTAVASLLVGQADGFLGVQPGAALYAADVYCGDAAGGAADRVAAALGWLARERVPVINISLVGPPNRLLERVVGQLVARGHLLVAAVGNDGPAAPPLYPAAYAGVVGVTGVDVARRALPEAARGPQVRFAAPGAAVAVAAGEAYAAARGTSFAAPFVAGLLSAALAGPDPNAAAAAVEALARRAVDLGPPGPDPTYGWGLVGEALRIEPTRVAASRRELH